MSEAVRTKRTEEEGLLSPIDRLLRTLQPGEPSLALFVSANGLSRREAFRQLEANRHKGRRPSWSSPKLR